MNTVDGATAAEVIRDVLSDDGSDPPHRSDPCHPTSSRLLHACDPDYGMADADRCANETTMLAECPA